MGFGRFLRHAVQDAEHLVDPRTYLPLGKAAVQFGMGNPRPAFNIAKGVGQSYINLAEHPLRSFESNPFSTALAVLPVGGGLGAAAKAGRAGGIAKMAGEMRAAGVNQADAAAALQREAARMKLTKPTMQADNAFHSQKAPPGAKPWWDNPAMDQHVMGGGTPNVHPITGRPIEDATGGARGQGTSGPAQYRTNSPQWLWLDSKQTHPGYDSNGMQDPKGYVQEAQAIHKAQRSVHADGTTRIEAGNSQEYVLPPIPNKFIVNDMASLIRYKHNDPAGQAYMNDVSKKGMFPDIGFRINPKGKPMAKGQGGNPLASPDMQDFMRNAKSNIDHEQTLKNFGVGAPKGVNPADHAAYVRKVEARGGYIDPKTGMGYTADHQPLYGKGAPEEMDIPGMIDELKRMGKDGEIVPRKEFSKASNLPQMGDVSEKVLPFTRPYQMDVHAPQIMRFPGGSQYGSTRSNGLYGHSGDSQVMQGSTAYTQQNMHNPDWQNGGLGHRPAKLSPEERRKQLLQQLLGRGKQGMKLDNVNQQGLIQQIYEQMYPGYGLHPIIGN